LLSGTLGRDRTLSFDFPPLQPTVFRDFTIRFLLIAATGKITSGMTYKQLLRGADGVVFVADSSPEHLYDTLTSYRETAKSLEAHQLEAGAVPVVLQYNKRDVARALSRTELDEGVNPRKHEVFQAVAVRGEGVLETFASVLKRTLASIAPQNEALPLLKGMSIDAYCEALIQGLYGRGTFHAPAPVVSAREDSRPIAVLLQTGAETTEIHQVAEPVTRKLSLAAFEAALSNAQAKGSVAPAPAPAPPATPAPSPPPAPPKASAPAVAAPAAAAPAPSPPPAPPAMQAPAPAPPAPPAETGAKAASLYDSLRAAVEVAGALGDGVPLEPALTTVLARLVEANPDAAVSASVLVPSAGDVRVAASHPLSGDPLARSHGAFRLVAGLAGATPKVHEPAGNPALEAALRGQGIGRVLSAPLRSSRGLHGVLVLYLADDADPPSPTLTAHVGVVATALALAIRKS
jgi:hypothetical protein